MPTEVQKEALKANILILLDSQSALKALESYQISSKLVWECLQTLQTLAADNSIELHWVLGHRGIDGNEKTDALAKRGVKTPYFGLEPGCGISVRTAKTTVKLWTGERHCNRNGLNIQIINWLGN